MFLFRHYIRLIVFFSFIALIGVIVIQFVWLRNAFIVSEEHFNNKVTLSLLNFRSELERWISSNNKPYTIKTLQNKRVINTIDSLLHEQFDNALATKLFYYTIVNNNTGTIEYYSDKRVKIPSKQAYKIALPSTIEPASVIHIFFPKKSYSIVLNATRWIILSIILIAILLFCFGFIVRMIMKQKKISELKNDFINNMTHEFKTPISSISMASEIMLRNPNSITTEKVIQYAKVIFDENQRLRIQTERILQTASLDKEALQLRKKETDIHQVILDTITNMCLVDEKKAASISFDFLAQNHIILVDKEHFVNVITNLIDNAYKYSIENPIIKVSTADFNNGVKIIVEDNGVGIRHDDQKYIFDKFFRVPTGNVHNVKGFGLGLYYVKTIVEAHNGFVEVDSNFGHGSKFSVWFPNKKNNI